MKEVFPFISPGNTALWVALPLGALLMTAVLLLDAARPVNLTTEPTLGLKWRTNGIGLPRCHVGWFKLRNGERALAVVTDPERVAFIPTRDGFSVLVSVADPERLIETLRRFVPTEPPTT
jgi:hypothetical protein